MLYDKNNQLTVADHSNSNKPDEGFSYDANGNRNSSGYQTGTNNRLNSDGKYNYAYDDEGNLISRTEISTNKVTEYQWDYRNRLAGVFDKDAAGNVTQDVGFKYDSQNRRISKKVGNAETRFVYDRDNVLFDFVAEGLSQPVLDQRYFYGSGVDQLLAQESGNGSVLWGLTDQLGTVKDWVNSSGSVANHVRYDSFGGVVSQSNAALGSRYGFTGREFDGETGLYYDRSRYYNAGIGRFIGEDSVGFGGGDANLYRYVGNSPIDSVDPFGTTSIELTALLNQAGPRSLDPKETIYRYPPSPNYSTALASATTWFYLITEPTARKLGKTNKPGSILPWLLNGSLKGTAGKGNLRPIGASGPEPTIDLFPDERGKHNTPGHEYAKEIKFEYGDASSYNPNLCLAPPPLVPSQEPKIVNDSPPSSIPNSNPFRDWRIPTIPFPIPKKIPLPNLI